jgi:hypothetical protein
MRISRTVLTLLTLSKHFTTGSSEKPDTSNIPNTPKLPVSQNFDEFTELRTTLYTIYRSENNEKNRKHLMGWITNTNTSLEALRDYTANQQRRFEKNEINNRQLHQIATTSPSAIKEALIELSELYFCSLHTDVFGNFLATEQGQECNIVLFGQDEPSLDQIDKCKVTLDYICKYKTLPPSDTTPTPTTLTTNLYNTTVYNTSGVPITDAKSTSLYDPYNWYKLTSPPAKTKTTTSTTTYPLTTDSPKNTKPRDQEKCVLAVFDGWDDCGTPSWKPV